MSNDGALETAVQKPSFPRHDIEQSSLASPFVGRERELADIRQRLDDPKCRLLTLVGPGGIGKTRLAREAAALLPASAFPDGIFFVALQPLTSPDLIIPAMVEALGLQSDPTLEPKEQLLNWLANTTALLFLDNFEHLLHGIDLLAEIARRAPAVKLLVTSREWLNLRGEWVLEIGGLTIPSGEADDNLEAYTAVQLFRQNAQRVKADFSLQGEVAAVGRICSVVGGIPLAIELASSWVRALSCADILQELERGLDILETNARDVPDRHRSMRAVLDASWGRLTPSEQAVFMKLAVFRGGFTLEAVQVVAAATPRILSVLVDQSWLWRDAKTGRYQLHELLRQYAEEKLLEAGQVDPTWDAHSRYYLKFVVERKSLMNGRRQMSALNEIGVDFENIRAAWNWGINQGGGSEINQVIYSLWFFFDTTCRYHEGEWFFGESVARLQTNQPELQPGQLLGQVLTVCGALCNGLQKFDESLAQFEQALQIFRAVGAQRDIAFCLLRLGDTLAHIGRALEAQACFQSTLNLCRNLQDDPGMMGAFYGVAVTQVDQGNWVQATQAVLESQAIAERIGNLWGLANATSLRGDILRNLGEYEEALRFKTASNVLYQELGVQWGIANTFHAMSYLFTLRGDYSKARESLLSGLTVAVKSHLTEYILYGLNHYVRLSMVRRDFKWAVTVYEAIEKVDNFTRNYAWMKDEYETLKDNLTAAELKAAQERAQALDLDTVVKMVMHELSAPVEQPLSSPDLLTAREIEVLRLIAAGRSNREIADQLVITLGTAKWYVSQIFSKLGVNSRTQATARARELHLTP